MNKKLVAAAIAGLLAAPLAQAQTANVTLYGSFRMEVAYTSFRGPSENTNLTRIDDVNSRWGLRGSEALGQGLNAIFQCETPITVDTASAGQRGMCGREGWVGLNGGWGEVKLGFGLTPYDDVKALTDLQGANSWENPNNGVSGGPGFARFGLAANPTGNQAQTNTGAFDNRYGSSISYKTPDWKGFSVRTQLARLDEQPTKEAWGWDTGAVYRNGPFTGGLAYAYHNDWAGLGGTILGLNDQQAWRLAASWNFGPVRVLGHYEWAQYDFVDASAKNILSAAGSPSKYRYQNWSLGAQVPWQAWTFNAQYNWRDKGLASAYDASNNTYAPKFDNLAVWDDGGGQHWSVSADYAFSKRTLLRMYYAWMRNEGTLTGWNYDAVSDTFSPNLPRSTIWAVSAGLWHHF